MRCAPGGLGCARYGVANVIGLVNKARTDWTSKSQSNRESYGWGRVTPPQTLHYRCDVLYLPRFAELVGADGTTGNK